MKDVVFNDIKNQAIKPDIIIMNSCVWDISRYECIKKHFFLVFWFLDMEFIQ
jgi:hypothetical protein